MTSSTSDATPPPSVPPLPSPPGLRERKKAATMHRVQETALALFGERGFDHVTIEQVAEAAEVSPRTVYRYFGTKEGLVLHDEYDDRALAGLAHYLVAGLSPWEAAAAALRAIEEEHFVSAGEATRQRIRIWFENPSVQSAAYLVIDEAVDEIGEIIAEHGTWSFAQSRVIASSLVWPLMAAVKNWYEAGPDSDWRTHIDEALAVLWPTGANPSG